MTEGSLSTWKLKYTELIFMKLRLHNQTIHLSKVKRVRSVGNLAILTFKNGESLKVVCGVSVPEGKMPCFSGTVEDLKSLIQRCK